VARIAVIELDVTAPWEPPDQPAPRSRLQGVVAAVLVAVVAATTLAAAASPTRLQPWYSFDGHYQLGTVTENVIYAVRVDKGDDYLVEAHRLTNGALLWQRSMTGVNSAVAGNGRYAVVSARDPDGRPVMLTVLDGATGRTLWQRSGVAPLSMRGDVVVVDDDDPSRYGEPSDDPTVPMPPEQHLDGLELATGRVRWSVTVPAGVDRALEYYARAESGGFEVRSLVELEPNGSLRVRDLATGQVTLRSTLEVPGKTEGLELYDGYLLVRAYTPDTERAGLPNDLRVYDAQSGRLLWRNTDEHLGFVQPCGPYLCVVNDGGTSAVEPKNGFTVWRIDRLDGTSNADVGNLLGYLNAAGEQPTVVVIEARTGRVTRKLAPWQLVTSVGWPRVLVWQRDRLAHGLIARLDVRTGRVTVLGRTDGWFGQPDCQVAAAYLVCATNDMVSVWRPAGFTMG
jgi:outer membrane protein assembly factor BamB